ncbi:uncharacterized protein LOC117178695 [Belonocnema kinseyi]|uniref:uncharacterized protein LOC117178695 n=1 Tax=Belonocnema kinseyi TaxID=2817044 RepID=UPI00143D6B5B|nr:uncharacterized protein LOC117178695 [Belonocnema kinseyi]
MGYLRDMPFMPQANPGISQGNPVGYPTGRKFISIGVKVPNDTYVHLSRNMTEPQVFSVLGRELRTRFSLLRPRETESSMSNNQNRQVQNHTGAKEVKFNIGDCVMVTDHRPGKMTWVKGKIKKNIVPGATFLVEVDTDVMWKWHSNQMVECSAKVFDENDNAIPETAFAPSILTEVPACLVLDTVGKENFPPPNPPAFLELDIVDKENLQLPDFRRPTTPEPCNKSPAEVPSASTSAGRIRQTPIRLLEDFTARFKVVLVWSQRKKRPHP